MHEIDAQAARQYIDACAVFSALEEARQQSEQWRGGMYWHKSKAGSLGSDYLVRTSPSGSERSLGARTPETEKIYAKFITAKQTHQTRSNSLQSALVQHKRLNRALRVGRIEPLVISLLDRIASSGLGEFFRVVGTHALYAYETAASVRLDPEVMATRDMDLLWDTRKRIMFFTQLARVDGSMLAVLQKVDASFRIRQGQTYTAVNDSGFEVDIIRREQVENDPNPIKLGDGEEDFWVVQARRANVLLDAPQFSCVVVGSNGAMARMNTVDPRTFVKFKRWLSEQLERDPIKRRRDALQAQAVEHLLQAYLP